MANLTELAEFVEQVLRLDTDMPVKGFDGFTIGTANEQAQVLANRTRWLKENLESLATLLKRLSDRNVVLSINKKTGAVTLDYGDVGAAAKEHTHTADEITPTDQRLFASPAEKSTWDGKQDKLISGETIKTVLGNSLLGAGNLDVHAKDLTTDETFQLISAEERTKWNNKQNPIVSGVDIATLHGYNLVGGGDVTLTADDVGADVKGAAEQAVDTHEQMADPHPQYLTEERAGDIFVENASANKPNGYLQLDDKGQIPANIAELFQARYLIVGTMEERLSLDPSSNITICLQTDENRVYYLGGNDDPSEESNWHQGRDADPSEVVSVFGRSGVITSNTGDYNTDQITESKTRVFVTPEQKQTWTGKQDKLVSGKNIRTINKKSLLGGTDIEISPDTIGAANRVHEHTVEEIHTTSEKQFVSENDKSRWDAKQVALVNEKNIKTINQIGVLGDGNIEISPSTIGAAFAEHSHTPDDIKVTKEAQFVSETEKANWNAKQTKLISGENSSTVFGKSLLDGNNIDLEDVDNLTETVGELFQAGEGIDIAYDKDLDKIVVKNTAKNVPSNSELTVITVEKAERKGYSFNVGSKMSDDFIAYTLIGDVKNAARVQSYNYTDAVAKTLIQTTLPEFDSDGHAIAEDRAVIETATKGSDGFYYSESIDVSQYEGIGLEVPMAYNTTIIPVFNSFSDDATAEVDGFKPFSSRIYPNFQAWKAYQSPMTDPDIIASVPSGNYWSDGDFLPKETYLGINTGATKEISGYAFQTCQKFTLSASTRITEWVLQGRNQDAEDWVDLDAQTGQSLKGAGEWKCYLLAEKANYQQYRILIKNAENPGSARTSIPRFQLLSSPSTVLIKGNDDKFYTIKEGKLTQLDNVTQDTFRTDGISTTQGEFKTTDLKAVSPFKLCSEVGLEVTYIRYQTSSQIVIHTSLEKTDSWYNLNAISATLKNGGDEDRIYVGVTVDGERWYTLKNNVWVSMGSLTGDQASAAKVMKNGMTVRDLTAVTKEQWLVLVRSISSGATLGIAYASRMKSSTDQRLPTKVTVDFGRIVHWSLSYPYDINITLTPTNIIFTPDSVKSANHLLKFCYKFN